MIQTIDKLLAGRTLKGSLTTLLTVSLLVLSGCGGGGGGSSDTPALNIKSAVYSDNATPVATDDKLYIYFTKSIDPNSIAADTSTNYTLEGTGAIGTASLSDYNDTIFHRHLITLNDAGSASIALVANDTNITMAENTITDASGEYPSSYNKVIVEKFRVMLRTGDTNNTTPNSDGDLQRGVARSYADNGQTVTDNVTGLIWQQEDDNTTRNWTDAGTYCTDITLDANSDFRLPTIEELESITNIGRRNPAIDPIFTNTVSALYWSSTTYVANPANAWNVYFYFGRDYINNKTDMAYVRCVR